ncbi:putative pentatricopeptide repeat-containing protein [Zea mays]|uniref:Putative pentatricopeptide repeat-containing protein n=1 Tax=Zea mays TaxID=4577 RepID=A0A3L6FA57_MAIZE|nr:putative pentatricopeptide repeat-containing protein [Zea mays]
MSTGGGSTLRELTALLFTLRRARLQHPAHAAQLHARLLISAGARPHPVLLTQLVSLYAAAGRLTDALRAFRAHLPSANLHTYAVLVSALARPYPDLAFSLFSGSRRQLRPSPHVISAVLAACAGLQPLCGRQVHTCAAKVVPPGDVFVYTGMVDVYAKGGDMESSRKVFDEMPNRGAASWNALLVGYARNKMCLEALSVFRELAAQGQEVSLDQVSVSSVLSTCAVAGALNYGRQMGPKPDASVLGALLWACMNCRDLEMGKEVAKKLFVIEPGNTGNYVLLANLCVTWKIGGGKGGAEVDDVSGVKEGKGMQFNQQLRTKSVPYEYFSKGNKAYWSFCILKGSWASQAPSSGICKKNEEIEQYSISCENFYCGAIMLDHIMLGQSCICGRDKGYENVT